MSEVLAPQGGTVGPRPSHIRLPFQAHLIAASCSLLSQPQTRHPEDPGCSPDAGCLAPALFPSHLRSCGKATYTSPLA